MSFTSTLQQIVDQCGGGIGIALMDREGISIEQVTATSMPEDCLDEDIGTAGAEFSLILAEVHKASDALGGGAVRELLVSLGRFNLIMCLVDEGYFLVLALTPDGNLGKARYLLRRHLPSIREEM